MTDTSAEAHTAIVEDHPYEPKDPEQPWGLCRHCNLQQAAHVRTARPYVSTCPPAPPADPPPGARPVEQGGSDGPEERPTPFPVAEIDMSAMQELVVEEEELRCWKCGTRDGARKLPHNGAILCPSCEQILKP